MANEYYAGTRIEYGDPKKDGEVTVIPQDEKVTGLPEDVMKELWDSGSLYVKEKQGKGDDAEEVQVTSSTGDVPGQPTPPNMQGENAEDPKPPGAGDPRAPGATPKAPAKAQGTGASTPPNK